MSKIGITQEGLHRLASFVLKTGQSDPGIGSLMLDIDDYDLDETPDDGRIYYTGDDALEKAKNVWGSWEGIVKHIQSASGFSDGNDGSYSLEANVFIPDSALNSEDLSYLDDGTFLDDLVGDTYGGPVRRFKKYDAYALEKTKGGIRFTLSFYSGLDV